MLLGELIQRVQSLYSKGVQSQSTRLRNRHIYSKLLTVRSKLISQEYKKKQRISSFNFQTLPCVELVKVPAHDCPCVPPAGCTVVRSKHKLPRPLSGLNGHIITSVSSIDRKIKIDEVNINELKYLKGNKYTTKRANYFIHNDYLYLTIPTKIQVVSVTGLFEDPIEVKYYPSYCSRPNKDCIDYLNTDFPIDMDMVDTLIEMSLNELISTFSQGIEDTTTNSRDSHIQQSK